MQASQSPVDDCVIWCALHSCTQKLRMVMHDFHYIDDDSSTSAVRTAELFNCAGGIVSPRTRIFRQAGIVPPFRSETIPPSVGAHTGALDKVLNGQKANCCFTLATVNSRCNWYLYGRQSRAMLTGRGNDQTVQGTNDDAQISKLCVPCVSICRRGWRHPTTSHLMYFAGLV